MAKSSCPVHSISAKSPPLIHDGVLTIQAHQVGWLLCGILAMISTITSFWLINKHLLFYTDPGSQRYIVRLLFMVPIYSIVTLAAYIFYNHASPFLILRDGYEGVVLSAFFYLMLQYLSPDTIEQRNIFRRKSCFDRQHRWKWMFPMGWVRYQPESGLYFLQLMKWGVLQYCVIRPSGAIISVIMEAAGLYCEESWSPMWAHVWIVSIVSISVTIAMYCLLQLYVVISGELAPHKPLLQLFSVKAVVFLTFWQSAVLGGLAAIGVVKDGMYMTADEINVGIAALLQTFEMVLFAFLHIKAFSYKPYRPKTLPIPFIHIDNPYPYLPPPALPKLTEDHTPRLAALRHAFSFVETWTEIRDGSIYLWKTMRHREAEPHSRFYHFEAVMGVERRTTQGTTTAEVFGSGQVEARYIRSKEYKSLSGRPHGQNQTQLSWDPALEPFYPLSNVDEELDKEPPSSLLRQHLVDSQESDGSTPFPMHLSPRAPMHDRFPRFITESKNRKAPIPNVPSRPAEIIMPMPLSAARLPRIDYTPIRT